MTGWSRLQRILRTDPADVGCEEVLRLLHVYVELVLGDNTVDSALAEAGRRYPGIAAHLLACGPCRDDYDGLVIAARAERLASDYPTDPGASS